jgi:hypothetical protein
MDLAALEQQLNSIEQSLRPKFVRLVVSDEFGTVVEHPSRMVDERLTAYRNHWELLHTCEDPTPEWFANWIDTIPDGGCGSCRSKVLQLLERPELQPNYYRWVPFTNDLHNSVNATLNADGSHPQFSFQDALRRWRPMPQPRGLFTSCKIVTSFSPKRIERQKWCLRSWLRSGFEVIAMQCPNELAAMRETFGTEGVSFASAESTEGYEFATPKINSILTAVTDGPFLILNSDCAIVDPWPIYQDVARGMPRTYLRWNYDAGSAMLASEFEWGLDGFLLWPEDAKLFPEDSPLGLGQPVWDYALPPCLTAGGRDWSINHKVVIAHENHEQAWSQDAWERGRAWMANLFPKLLIGTAAYRYSLDPDYRYDNVAGKWIYSSS